MDDRKWRKKKRGQKAALAVCILLAAGGFVFGTAGIKKRISIDSSKSSGKETVMQDTSSQTLSGEMVLDETQQPETEDLQVQGFQEPTEMPAAAVMEQEYQRLLNLPAGEFAAKGAVEEGLASRLFYATEIDEGVLSRISGKSYTPNDQILSADLSYLRMLYYGPDQNTYIGEMIVNQQIKEDVLEIFQTLYENRYPIERMTLIDTYDADDQASMEANNTSAFNYRTIQGSSKLSNHSYGMAIDLNPKYNPYVKTGADGSISCQPQGSAAYADRSQDFAFKIDRNDLAYQLFTQAGFTWGGNWNSVKDYQHFEKEFQ